MELHTGRKFKVFRLDNGGEYKAIRLCNFVKKKALLDTSSYEKHRSRIGWLRIEEDFVGEGPLYVIARRVKQDVSPIVCKPSYQQAADIGDWR